MRALVVTNDFPPKHGGIQLYHRELWRRLPPDEVVVYTTAFEGAAEHDAALPFRVVRAPERVLLPVPAVLRRVRALAVEVEADVLVVDPPMPVGLVAPAVGLPYVVLVHGGVVLQARAPALRSALGRVLGGAAAVVAAGSFPAAEVRRVLRPGVPVVEAPPGVDLERFRPLGPAERGAARRRLGLPEEARVVVSVSRLVPRKGMDVLVEAAALLGPGRPDLVVAVGGGGRDRARLERLVAARRAPVRFLGRVADADLAGAYGCADVFAMLCRDRWGGLEQEGFGMVFLEAAACGVPSVAGLSGGSADAVDDGVTGEVVRRPRDPEAAALTLARLLDDPDRRRRQGEAARARAEREFSWDHVAGRVHDVLVAAASGTGS